MENVYQFLEIVKITVIKFLEIVKIGINKFFALPKSIIMAVGIVLFIILCIMDRLVVTFPTFLFILFVIIDMAIMLYGAIGE